MNQIIQTLKGFRDFLPEEKRKRDFIMAKIIETFTLFGFEPIETPSLEYASLILGKYGTETDKLVYTFKDRGGRDVALKYDQTVPTARVLAEYQNQLPKFFRRYQIQNVFRADKPQKGRYREFTQCDIDIFGATSDIGIADAEILSCTYKAYQNIGFKKVILKINDRKTLINALKPFSKPKNKSDTFSFSLIQTIDKLDKIGEKGVITELIEKGLTSKDAQKALLSLKQSTISPELENIISLTQKLGVPKNAIEFVPTLARGLDYYTGMIVEVIIPKLSNSSVAGGGRYDMLLNQLAGIDIPAVGISFGFDRTVEAAETLGLLPQNKTSIKTLITLFDKSTQFQSLKLANNLRSKNIGTEVYPAIEKLDKQLKYADKKGIPFVIIIGPDEACKNQVTLKNMSSGDQKTVKLDQLPSFLAS